MHLNQLVTASTDNERKPVGRVGPAADETSPAWVIPAANHRAPNRCRNATKVDEESHRKATRWLKCGGRRAEFEVGLAYWREPSAARGGSQPYALAPSNVLIQVAAGVRI